MIIGRHQVRQKVRHHIIIGLEDTIVEVRFGALAGNPFPGSRPYAIPGWANQARPFFQGMAGGTALVDRQWLPGSRIGAGQ